MVGGDNCAFGRFGAGMPILGKDLLEGVILASDVVILS